MQEVRYEGRPGREWPGIIDAMTDNPVRTVADVRHALSKHGGNLGTSGSVAFQFSAWANWCSTHEQPGAEDRLLEVALDAGAEDVQSEGRREPGAVRRTVRRGEGRRSSPPA